MRLPNTSRNNWRDTTITPVVTVLFAISTAALVVLVYHTVKTGKRWDGD